MDVILLFLLCINIDGMLCRYYFFFILIHCSFFSLCSLCLIHILWILSSLSFALVISSFAIVSFVRFVIFIESFIMSCIHVFAFAFAVAFAFVASSFPPYVVNIHWCNSSIVVCFYC